MDLLVIDHGRTSHDRKVAVATGNFAEGITGPFGDRGKQDRINEFVAFFAGGHHADEESGGFHSPLLPAWPEADLAVERDKAQREFGTGIRVGRRAADGAARA